MGLSSFACLLVRLDGSLLARKVVSHTATSLGELVHDRDILAKGRERVKSKKLMTLDSVPPHPAARAMPERIYRDISETAECRASTFLFWLVPYGLAQRFASGSQHSNIEVEQISMKNLSI